MPTIFDQADIDYINDGTISDGATIAASGVRLTNTDSGRIYVGVTFTAGGSTLINELGGVIRVSQFDQSFNSLLVSGSSGADTVINAGLIGSSSPMGVQRQLRQFKQQRLKWRAYSTGQIAAFNPGQ